MGEGSLKLRKCPLSSGSFAWPESLSALFASGTLKAIRRKEMLH